MGGGGRLIRRLTTDDAGLLQQACDWDATTPRWWREMDAVFNQQPSQLIEKLSDPRYWFIGLFQSSLQAVIIVENHGDGLFEGHLMAQRRIATDEVITVIRYLLNDLLQFGLRQAFAWAAERHRGLRRLCAEVGMRPDGIVMYRGAYHGQVIKWLRYSISRETIETA